MLPAIGQVAISWIAEVAGVLARQNAYFKKKVALQGKQIKFLARPRFWQNSIIWVVQALKTKSGKTILA